MGSLPIIHEDDALIAVAKPAGIATANVPAGEESVFRLVTRMLAMRSGAGRGGEPFLGVVSRLDRPVSGVVVFAKTPAAAAHLARQFRDRSVQKTYVAIVEGRFPAPLDTWVEWVDGFERPRHGASRVVPSAGDAAAVEARLRARVLVRMGEVSLVDLRPATGRRHQLRAQLASRTCPIVGDRLYGARVPFSEGIALHARSLSIEHPGGICRLTLTADVPAAWRSRFAALLNHIPPPEEVDFRDAPRSPLRGRPPDARADGRQS